MNLRDQLKKAKLLDEKRSRQLAHEERVHRKKVGREGLEAESKQRGEELTKLQAQERQQAKEAQAELDQQRKRQAEHAACMDILAKEAKAPTGRGQKFYFQLEDGQLPYLECDEQLRFQLQGGGFVVIQRGPVGSHDYGLLPSEFADRVRKTVPEAIVWAVRGR